MSNFLTRLLDEKNELDVKIEKLTQFIESDNFKTIDASQQTLLNIQVKAMSTYSQILLERITLLTLISPQESAE